MPPEPDWRSLSAITTVVAPDPLNDQASRSLQLPDDHSGKVALGCPPAKNRRRRPERRTQGCGILRAANQPFEPVGRLAVVPHEQPRRRPRGEPPRRLTLSDPNGRRCCQGRCGQSAFRKLENELCRSSSPSGERDHPQIRRPASRTESKTTAPNLLEQVVSCCSHEPVRPGTGRSSGRANAQRISTSPRRYRASRDS